MLKADKHIRRLITAYILGTLSEKQQEELDLWLSDTDNKKVFDRITDKNLVYNKTLEYESYDIQTAWESLDPKLSKKRGFPQWISWAASLLILIGISLFAWREAAVVKEQINWEKQARIQAGKTEAVMYFANGEIVSLEADSSRILKTKENLVLEQEQSKLEVKDDKLNAEHSKRLNRIETKRGDEYELKLPDGSIVKLNADSYLEFPSRFDGNLRSVKAGGELFFQVKSNPDKPFTVEYKGNIVKVLGTSFNFRAYEDDPFIKTSLVEGKVVCINSENKAMDLSPGNEILLRKKTGEMKVQEADLEMATAWVHGRIYYDNTSLSEIISDIARWYDVDFFFLNERVEQEHFTIDIPRYGNLNELLMLLEQTGEVKFNLEEEIITVQ